MELQQQETAQWREIIEQLEIRANALPDPNVQKLAKQTVELLNTSYSSRIAHISATVVGEIMKIATIKAFIDRAQKLSELLQLLAGEQKEQQS